MLFTIITLSVFVLSILCIGLIIVAAVVMNNNSHELEKRMTLNDFYVCHPKGTLLLGISLIILLVLVAAIIALAAWDARAFLLILLLYPFVFVLSIPCFRMVFDYARVILRVEGKYFVFTSRRGEMIYYNIQDVLYAVEIAPKSYGNKTIKGYSKKGMVFDINSGNVGYNLLLEKLKAEGVRIKNTRTPPMTY